MEKIIAKYLEIIGDEEISKQMSHKLYQYIAEQEGTRLTIDYAIDRRKVEAIHQAFFKTYDSGHETYGYGYVIRNIAGSGYLPGSGFEDLLPLNKSGNLLLKKYYKKMEAYA